MINELLTRHKPLFDLRLGLFLSTLIVILGLYSPGYSQDKGPFLIVVKGVEGDLLKNVELALGLPEGLVKETGGDEHLLGLFLKDVPQKVREALEPFGYYHGEIQTAMDRAEDRFRLVVTINPNQPVRISTLKWTIQGPGMENERFRKGLPEFPLKEGDILRQDLYEEAKGTLKEKAQEAGYLDADFPVHLIDLSLEQNMARIELVMDTGPQYYFGDVTFVSPLPYPETFLKRYVAFRTGRAFNPQSLARTQLNFIKSDRFREADLEAVKEEAKDFRIPVRITLSPSKPKRFKVGVGYETDLGPGLLARYQDLNFLQGGHEINTELRISQRLQGLALDYVIPRTGTIDDKMTLKGGYKREITDTYDSRSLFAQYEYEYNLGRGRLAAAYLQLLQSDYSIASQQGVSTMAVPGVRFWQRRFDHPVHPTKGYRYALETRGSTSFLGSDGSFGQVLAQGNSMTPLGGGFSVLLRFQGGITVQNQPLINLPPTLRFFAGGDNSVRGYAYQSLGPQDTSGKVIGGRHLIVGSLEIEKAVSSTWGVAAFYDLGNAFDDARSIELKQGAGLGIRFYTPVGPIRVDLARQIGESSPQFRLHLTIGFEL
jgi:translocation and assembly module TamA